MTGFHVPTIVKEEMTRSNGGTSEIPGLAWKRRHHAFTFLLVISKYREQLEPIIAGCERAGEGPEGALHDLAKMASGYLANIFRYCDDITRCFALAPTDSAALGVMDRSLGHLNDGYTGLRQAYDYSQEDPARERLTYLEERIRRAHDALKQALDEMGELKLEKSGRAKTAKADSDAALLGLVTSAGRFEVPKVAWARVYEPSARTTDGNGSVSAPPPPGAPAKQGSDATGTDAATTGSKPTTAEPVRKIPTAPPATVENALGLAARRSDDRSQPSQSPRPADAQEQPSNLAIKTVVDAWDSAYRTVSSARDVDSKKEFWEQFKAGLPPTELHLDSAQVLGAVRVGPLFLCVFNPYFRVGFERTPRLLFLVRSNADAPESTLPESASVGEYRLVRPAVLDGSRDVGELLNAQASDFKSGLIAKRVQT